MTKLNTQTSSADAPLTVVARPQPLQWLVTAMAGAFLIFLLYSIATNPNFQWGTVAGYLFSPRILSGLGLTIGLTLIVMITGSVVGTIVALMFRSSNRVLTIAAQAYVGFFRGAPALVQLIFWYNLSLLFPRIELALPHFGTIISIATNDLMTPLGTAVWAFTLVTGAYMAETIRGGLNAVNKGQYEAAASLGMRRGQVMFRIILPQAVRVILPPAGNEAINVLKSTSLVSVIALGDLLYSVQSIYARTFETIPLLLVATIWYLALVSLMTLGQKQLERKFSAR